SKLVWTITIDGNVDDNKTPSLNGFTVEDADFADMTNISVVGTKNGQAVDVQLTGSGNSKTISGDADYVTITFERPLTNKESNDRKALTDGQKATAENTVTVKDKDGGTVGKKGTAEIGPLKDSFGKKLLSTDNKTVEGSYNDPAGNEPDEELNWQIVIENYDNFSGDASTLVDIMSTGGNGGKHYISDKQIQDIEITFQTMDGTQTKLKANSGAFKVTSQGKSQFTINFNETYCKNNSYVRAEINYSTTAETKGVEKGNTETFRNTARDVDVDFTFTRTNPSVVPKHSLNFTKSWDRDNASVRPDSIKIQLQRKDANGQWVAYPPENSSDWTNNNGTYTNNTYKYVTQAATQTVQKPYTFKWNDLPQYSETDKTKVYEYRIVELGDNNQPVENGKINGKYKVSYDDDIKLTGDRYFNITNTYVMTSIEVEKHWKGDDKDNSERLPVTVKLKKRLEGETTWSDTEYTQVLNAKNGYEYKWDSLPGVDETTGKDIYYKIEEEPVPNYTASYSGDNTDGINSGLLEVTNTYNMMYIKADKYWDDGSGAVKKIPADIESLDLELQWKLKGTGFEEPSSLVQIPQVSKYD
ncbi:MAG: Cna B-type domain-containing protein, partial [Ruminococcus sp.]|nr:Cna B-type domain-containing protein [Ruminococcus sp.]